MQLLTVIESPIFTKYWPDYWSHDEHGEFMAFIAGNPEAGDVVAGSGGCRKVRWGAGGKGKRGGVRIITSALAEDGQVWLLIGYTKAKFDNLPTEFLVTLRKEIDNAQND